MCAASVMAADHSSACRAGPAAEQPPVGSVPRRSDTTRITELVTGLGMLGGDHPLTMLPVAPGELRNVDATWDGLVESWDDPARPRSMPPSRTVASSSRHPGRAASTPAPATVEWTGPQRSPGDEVAPVDLRVDDVYLVSCKYLSGQDHDERLARPRLRAAADRRPRWRSNVDWYRHVAAAEFDRLWSASAAWFDRTPSRRHRSRGPGDAVETRPQGGQRTPARRRQVMATRAARPLPGVVRRRLGPQCARLAGIDLDRAVGSRRRP